MVEISSFPHAFKKAALYTDANIYISIHRRAVPSVFLSSLLARVPPLLSPLHPVGLSTTESLVPLPPLNHWLCDMAFGLQLGGLSDSDYTEIT